MSHTFVAYIDESGDDGLRKFREPGGRGGASKWLIISALVYRRIYDLEAVSWRDKINSKMPDKKSRNLHFADLKHGQKLAVAKEVANLPVRAISVIGFKINIPEGTYTEKNQLYFYLTRYLIERISWLCRDMRPRAPEGNGEVKIIFSRRGGMSYDEFKKYMTRLKSDDSGVNKTHWPVIDIGGIDALDHSKLAGLQLADVIASAVANGLEPDPYGNCECRYADILKPIIYNRDGNFFSYGLKFHPSHGKIDLSDDQQMMIDCFK